LNLARHFGTSDVQAGIEALAAAVRGSISCYKALDVERLAALRKIHIQMKPLHVDALLRQAEDGYVAVINASTTRRKQRFSVAHEIGHVEMYNVTNLSEAIGHSVDRRSGPGGSEVERLCDLFATELLMPRDAWQKKLIDGGISLRFLYHLSDLYDVSFPAAAARIAEANIWKCTVILWDRPDRGEDRKQLQPCRIYSNMGMDSYQLEPLPSEVGFLTAGSPFRSHRETKHVTGAIALLVGGRKMEYFGESDLLPFDRSKIVTMIIAEPGAHTLMNLSSWNRGSEGQLGLDWE
jgi:Zn-dependent peptidase ImmA (M78 family)